MYSAIRKNTFLAFSALIFLTACLSTDNSQNSSVSSISAVFGISTTELKAAQINKPYMDTITATGGTDYIFSLIGVLPAGLSLESNGKITGTVTAATGIYNFQIKCTDSADTAKTDIKDLSIIVLDNTWTVMLHFAIDNNIDYEYERDYGIVTNYINTLQTIKRNDTLNKLKILLLMDGFNGNTTFKDGIYNLRGSANLRDDLVVDIAELNSGDIKSTKNFFDYVVKKYPAKHYFYSIFNHGGGFDNTNKEGTGQTCSNENPITSFFSSLINLLGGIAIDETSGNDTLSYYELGKIAQYFSKITGGDKIDIFFPFACLMGNTELAYELRQNVNYLLFSEEAFPADYWSYEALSGITSDYNITPVNLGKKFCDSAYTYFSQDSVKLNFTLSLVDNSKIDGLIIDLNSYADAANSVILGDTSKAVYFNNAADNAFSMDTDGLDPNFYYIDLGGYLNNIINSPSIDAAVKNKAQSVITSLQTAVLYTKNYGFNNATGMTIFHNIWKSRYQYDVNFYKTILSAGTGSWALYMETMTNLETIINPPPLADTYEPDNSSYSNIIRIGDIQNHTLHEGTVIDADLYTLDLRAMGSSKYICIETSKYNIDTSTSIYLYDSNGYLISTVNSNVTGMYSKIVTNLNPGIYYLKVRGYYTRYGDYKIAVSEYLADSYENDDSFVNAKVILAGSPQTHNFIPFGESDFLTFNIDSEKSVTIETKPNSLGSDTVLYLYDSNKALLERNDDNNGTRYSKITRTLPSGDYFIKISDEYTKGGDYIIEVTTY